MHPWALRQEILTHYVSGWVADYRKMKLCFVQLPYKAECTVMLPAIQLNIYSTITLVKLIEPVFER